MALSVSAKRPHKNLARLIGALARIPQERRPLLALPGYPTPHEQELRELAAERGVAEDVRFLAWVSAEELDDLYAAADCFVFPSLYEGFGFPVLEAMARGVPVATSGRAEPRRGGGRRRADVRPRGRGLDRGGDRGAARRRVARASGSARPGSSERRASPGSAPRS